MYAKNIFLGFILKFFLNVGAHRFSVKIVKMPGNDTFDY